MNTNDIDNYQNFRASIQNTGNLLEEFSKQHRDFFCSIKRFVRPLKDVL